MGQNSFGNNIVLITGASGLVGAHLMYTLLQKGVRVRAMVRNQNSKHKAESFFSLYSPSYNVDLLEWFFGDITEYQDVRRAVNSVGYVFHCAGYVTFKPNETEKLLAVNVQGTTNIVNACIEHNVVKLCHMSSVAALGKAKVGNITEDCDYELKERRSDYGYSKYLGEIEVWRGVAEGLSAVIVNPSVIIGPGQWNQSSGKLFTQMHKGLKFYTQGTTGYIGVYDVVACMIKLMQSKFDGERYILNAENVTYKDMFTFIANSINKSAPTIEATPILLKIAGIITGVKSIFTGKQNEINSRTIKTATALLEYSNQKIVSGLNVQFEPIEHVVLKTGALFKRFYLK